MKKFVFALALALTFNVMAAKAQPQPTTQQQTWLESAGGLVAGSVHFVSRVFVDGRALLLGSAMTEQLQEMGASFLRTSAFNDALQEALQQPFVVPVLAGPEVQQVAVFLQLTLRLLPKVERIAFAERLGSRAGIVAGMLATYAIVSVTDYAFETLYSILARNIGAVGGTCGALLATNWLFNRNLARGSGHAHAPSAQ